MAKYRIKAGSAPYYHKSRFYNPGSIIDLPDSIKPGKGMEKVEEPKQEKPAKQGS